MLSKYIIEDNIDFFKELNSSKQEHEDKISENKISEDKVIENLERCSITGDPLSGNIITLKCGHKFNYEAIFQDVYQQKLKTNDSERQRVHIKCIRCPYCRTIHPQLLPYFEDTPKLYGVNFYSESLDYCVLKRISITIDQCAHIHTNGSFCNNKHGTSFENEYFCLEHLGKKIRSIKNKLEINYREFVNKKTSAIKTDFSKPKTCQFILTRGPRKGLMCQKRGKSDNYCSAHIKNEPPI
jgi:hypothetical protein